MNVKKISRIENTGQNRTPIILAFISTLIATVGSASDIQLQAEPNYGGRALSAWVKELPVPADFDQKKEEYATNAAVAAVTKIGTNAVPYLLKWFKKPDGVSRMETDLAFIYLGDAAKPAISELTKSLIIPELNEDATIVLLRLGHDGIMALTNGFASSDWSIRASTALSFCIESANDSKHSNDVAVIRFQQERRIAIRGIVALLQDPNYKVGTAAAYALGNFKQEPDAVIPALTRIMNDTNVDVHVRRVATNSFNRLTK